MSLSHGDTVLSFFLQNKPKTNKQNETQGGSPQFPSLPLQAAAFKLDIKKNFSERVVIHWVTISEGVQGKDRYGTEGRRQWAQWEWAGFGFGDLRGLSQPF